MEWIKVSDRLPEVDTDVLVTVELPRSNGGVQRYVTTCVYDCCNVKFLAWDHYFEEMLELRGVVAWMPYPNAYNSN